MTTEYVPPCTTEDCPNNGAPINLMGPLPDSALPVICGRCQAVLVEAPAPAPTTEVTE